MARLLSDDDIEAIALQLVSFSGLTNEEHKKHHEAFAIYIEMQTRKMASRERMRENIGGWLILSFLGLIGTAVYHGTMWIIQRGH